MAAMMNSDTTFMNIATQKANAANPKPSLGVGPLEVRLKLGEHHEQKIQSLTNRGSKNISRLRTMVFNLRTSDKSMQSCKLPRVAAVRVCVCGRPKCGTLPRQTLAVRRPV